MKVIQQLEPEYSYFWFFLKKQIMYMKACFHKCQNDGR